MKKKTSVFFAGLILAVISLALLLATCSLAGDLEEIRSSLDGGTFTLTVSDISELESQLSAQKGGKTSAKAGKLIATFDLGNMADPNDNWQKMLGAIDTAEKYVELDLSACEMDGISFDPIPAVSTGKNRIVSIVLPDKATSIAAGTTTSNSFLYFSNLKTAAGTKITNIGDYTFSNCASLSSVNFPETINIGLRAFYYCENLSSINFTKAVTIRQSAFFYCSKLTSVYLPAAEDIDYIAFCGSGITNAILPKAVNINQYAFFECKKLTSVTFPRSANIEDNPFEGCSSLKTFNLEGSGPLNVLTVNNTHGLYRGILDDDAELIAWPAAQGNLTVYGIVKINFDALCFNTNPLQFTFGDVTEVDAYAFYGCTGLSYISLRSVTVINDYAFADTGGNALEIRIGMYAPPNLGMSIIAVDVPKTVTVKVPIGFKIYYDQDWQDGFKGAGWTEGIKGTGTVNPNITLNIEEY